MNIVISGIDRYRSLDGTGNETTQAPPTSKGSMNTKSFSLTMLFLFSIIFGYYY